MSFKNFKNLFGKKRESTMQKKAIESRKKRDGEVQDKLDEAHHNLETLIDEITTKKKMNE